MQLGGVGIMTIGAGHTLLIHLALQVGTEDIDLFENLSIRKVESLFEKCQAVAVHMGTTELVVFRDQRST